MRHLARATPSGECLRNECRMAHSIRGAENAGVENAGVEKAGVDSIGGKCRSGKYRS